MMIHDVTKLVGRHKRAKRVGRGIGSGHGKTCGRGTKGAGARSGWTGSIRASREGGQMPLFRRVPKRGFSNAMFKKEFAVVNLRVIDGAFGDGAEVTAEVLAGKGLLVNSKLPLKVLGTGKITKKVHVKAAAFSKSAEEKIRAAGGSVTVG